MKMKLSILTVLLLLLVACSTPSASAPAPVIQADQADQTVISAPAPAGTQAPASNALLAPVSVDRMIIKDAQLELLVGDADRVLSQITQLAADTGGYVLSSQSWLDAGQRSATIRIGVPVLTFESSLNILRQMGIQVLQETASGQDVSAEFLDLETRLLNLEATADRVRTFLDNADSVEESLEVSAQLSELEGQIEQIKGQMRFYAGRAAFSTITVTLIPDLPTATPGPTATATPGWSAGDSFQEASQVSQRLGQGLINVLIWTVVVIGPYALIGGIVIWLAIKILRKF
jgi:hypothetical protein